MASAPVNTEQANRNPYDSTITDGTLDVTQLGYDAIGVVLQDSIRSGGFIIEPRLVASYLASNSLYQYIGARYLLPYLAGVDSNVRSDVGAILYNMVFLPITARVFGGKISYTNALMTSAGARFASKGAKMLASSGSGANTPSLGPSSNPVGPPSGGKPFGPSY